MQEICKSWEIRIYYYFVFKWLDFGRLEEESTFIYNGSVQAKASFFQKKTCNGPIEINSIC